MSLIQGLLREHNAVTRQPIELELSFGLAEWQQGQDYDALCCGDGSSDRGERRSGRAAALSHLAGELVQVEIVPPGVDLAVADLERSHNRQLK